MAQISTVTSEALQSKLRELLPSQNGFGEDLQASNVILPTIDLTTAAEGSGLPDYLQTAMTLTDITMYGANFTTVNIVNTPGFYRVIATISCRTNTGGNNIGNIRITNGITTKDVIEMVLDATTNGAVTATNYDIVVLLQSGETLQAVSNRSDCFVAGSVRQIADINGKLVNPTGYTPQ
jgi:hypothetical protein